MDKIAVVEKPTAAGPDQAAQHQQLRSDEPIQVDVGSDEISSLERLVGKPTPVLGVGWNRLPAGRYKANLPRGRFRRVAENLHPIITISVILPTAGSTLLPERGMRMILVFCAVLILTILLFGLFLRDKEQHYPAEHHSSSYSSCRDLSVVLREVCWDVLTPKTLMFLAANAPAKVVTSFGQQQQRLARYSLRVASDTLVQSLADGGCGRSSFSRGFVGVRRSEARGLFLLVACTAGRMGLGALRSVNWGVPRSIQASISTKVLMSLGTLLAESTSVVERRLRPAVVEQSEARHEALVSDRPSTEVSLSEQIHEALLNALPNDMSRMIYIATMRDNNSGHYYYPELTRKFNADIVDRAMLACHGQLFERVVQLSLEDLTESLDVYMASTHVLKARVIQSWKKLRAYRATIPIDSDPISAEVFFMKVEVAVAILEARLPADPYGVE